jgi:hypothetical protein
VFRFGIPEHLNTKDGERQVTQSVATLDRTAEAESERFLYGVIAEFEHAEDVVKAARQTYEAGYRRMDAYSPFPVEGLSEALGFRDHHVPWIMFIGGVVGCVGGFGFLTWALGWDYPLNIGGRPRISWPMYIPITFEITVLLSALSGIVGMFWLNGLPKPYHPVFDAPDFELASSSRFFLCIESEDPHFDRVKTRQFMETLGAAQVSEVELKK